jgi:hypothetical protein
MKDLTERPTRIQQDTRRLEEFELESNPLRESNLVARAFSEPDGLQGSFLSGFQMALFRREIPELHSSA